MGGYPSCWFLPSESEPTQSSIPLLGDASGRRRNPRLPWVGRSRHSTCMFSLISDVFPMSGYVAVLADMRYGRRPTVQEPSVPSVRNRTERPREVTDCPRDAAGYTLGGGVRVPGGPHGLQNRCGGASSQAGSIPVRLRHGRPIHPRVRSDPRCLGTVDAMSAIARLQTFAERAESRPTSSSTSSTPPRVVASAMRSQPGSSCRCR